MHGVVVSIQNQFHGTSVTDKKSGEKILRHLGLWRDTQPRASPAAIPELFGADQGTQLTRPEILKSQIKNLKSDIASAGTCQPELFYITDEDCQPFPDDE